MKRKLFPGLALVASMALSWCATDNLFVKWLFRWWENPQEKSRFTAIDHWVTPRIHCNPRETQVSRDVEWSWKIVYITDQVHECVITIWKFDTVRVNTATLTTNTVCKTSSIERIGDDVSYEALLSEYLECLKNWGVQGKIRDMIEGIK